MPLLSNCTKWSLFGLFTSLSFTICVHQLPFPVKRWIEFHFNLRKSCTKKIVHEKILSCTNREIVHDFFRARIRARYFSWFRTLLYTTPNYYKRQINLLYVSACLIYKIVFDDIIDIIKIWMYFNELCTEIFRNIYSKV